jgi:hypothetical protein
MKTITPPSITAALFGLILRCGANFGFDESPCLGAFPAAIDLPVFPGMGAFRLKLLRAEGALIFIMSCHTRIILKPH